ncbi:MAG: peptidase T [Deltaproteobacteria bacterium]|nr:peptidase T [Deltaproteobacteria bacterium]
MPNAAHFKPEVLARLLRYVRIDTQSDDRNETFPSTPGQLTLLGMLADELRAMGVPRVVQDEHGYVMALLPGTISPEAARRRAVPTVGFLAHVDTSPDVSGKDVLPQVIERYDGGVIRLPGAPEVVIDPAEHPELGAVVGHGIVTSDGTTLLGADDKAGVAEIMTAVAHLAAHREIERGPVAVAFTPDEEIGRGTSRFDVAGFGASYAYTLDGSAGGAVESETFSGDAAEVTIDGRSEHPGKAKGKMVSAMKLAGELLARLPKDRLCPEATEDREGFIHPTRVVGNVQRAVVSFILRDFETPRLADQRRLIEDLCAEVGRLDPRARVKVEFSESYRNMRDALREVPFVVAYAEDAIRRTGLAPYFEPIRGGTDGARLTAMGLPTPNLFTGGYNYHSCREWASVDYMAQAVQMVVELVQIWAERGLPRSA